MFISLFALAFYMSLYAKSLFNPHLYGFDTINYELIWVGFSLSWILAFLLLIYLIPSKYQIATYFFINLAWNILFFAQICYVQQLGKFLILSDLFIAGEGFQYIKSIFLNLNIGMLITNAISLAISIIVVLINRQNKMHHKINKVNIAIMVFLIFIARFSSYLALGEKSDATWEENYNAKNIYINYTNPNTSMYISGYYEYTFRSIYKYFYNLITLDKKAIKNKIDEYNRIYGVNHLDNDHTGIFKNKNVIYIMMESIDSWIIDEKTTPNIYRLRQEGLNFQNRYSPFFNGGQTINSEFACNTGMYAITSRQTIYDIDDVDYPYSLANVLSRNGYSVNSFHANSSDFYNRGSFHRLLGYNHHYSFLDMQKSGLLNKKVNYFRDANALSDDTIVDLMTNGKKFLAFYTTYSAHLEYTKDNKVYKDIGDTSWERDYPEEEAIYRRLAHDTDEAIGILIDKLRERDLLDDTILVLVTDHYSYGYSDSLYVAIRKGVMNNRKQLQNTPFIIWSPSVAHEDITTILDTADILPTLLNMLGITYDANNYLGTDVFGDEHDDFVWFDDGTYIAGSDVTLDDRALLTKANYNILKNQGILLTNYYGT